MSATEDCLCGYDGWLEMCIRGEVYGPCSSDNCGGGCEPLGKCTHECHTPAAAALVRADEGPPMASWTEVRVARILHRADSKTRGCDSCGQDIRPGETYARCSATPHDGEVNQGDRWRHGKFHHPYGSCPVDDWALSAQAKEVLDADPR